MDTEKNDNPTLKVSICQKCKGFVTAAVEYAMTTKTKNAFSKEVVKYDLAVKTMTLSKYRKANLKFCTCD